MVRVTAWLRRPLMKIRGKIPPEGAVVAISTQQKRRGQSIPFDERNPIATLTEDDRPVNVPALSVEELLEAELILIRKAQAEAFPELLELVVSDTVPKRVPHNLGKLRPRWDKEQQLIRVAGRVELAYEADNMLPPILLPAKHPITDLIIRHEHV